MFVPFTAAETAMTRQRKCKTAKNQTNWLYYDQPATSSAAISLSVNFRNRRRIATAQRKKVFFQLSIPKSRNEHKGTYYFQLSSSCCICMHAVAAGSSHQHFHGQPAAAMDRSQPIRDDGWTDGSVGACRSRMCGAASTSVSSAAASFGLGEPKTSEASYYYRLR